MPELTFIERLDMTLAMRENAIRDIIARWVDDYVIPNLEDWIEQLLDPSSGASEAEFSIPYVASRVRESFCLTDTDERKQWVIEHICHKTGFNADRVSIDDSSVTFYGKME